MSLDAKLVKRVHGTLKRAGYDVPLAVVRGWDEAHWWRAFHYAVHAVSKKPDVLVPRTPNFLTQYARKR